MRSILEAGSEQLSYFYLKRKEKKIYENTPSEEIVELNLDELRPNPYQPRINFNEDALKDLKQRAIAEMKIESNYQRAFFVERQRDNSKSR